MKPAGSRVTLRESIKPDASYCEPGDVLETSTGRRYEVLEVKGRLIKCRVMRLNERLPVGARVGTWTWNARKNVR